MIEHCLRLSMHLFQKFEHDVEARWSSMFPCCLSVSPVFTCKLQGPVYVKSGSDRSLKVVFYTCLGPARGWRGYEGLYTSKLPLVFSWFNQAFNSLFEKKNLSKALENTLLVYLYRDTLVESPHFRTEPGQPSTLKWTTSRRMCNCAVFVYGSCVLLSVESISGPCTTVWVGGSTTVAPWGHRIGTPPKALGWPLDCLQEQRPQLYHCCCERARGGLLVLRVESWFEDLAHILCENLTKREKKSIQC